MNILDQNSEHASPNGKPAPVPSTWIRTSVETITPEQAARWLADPNRPKNRQILKPVVREMASDILAGKFDLNGESIVLGEDGELLDGQHRCSAVVMAGVPLQAVVVRGVPRDRMRSLDSGRARTGRDRHIIAGNSHPSLRAALESSLRMLTEKSQYRMGISKALTIQEMFAQEIEWAVDRIGGKKIRAPVAGVLSYAWPVASAPTEAFLDQYLTGVGIERDSPVLALLRLTKGLVAEDDGSSKPAYSGRAGEPLVLARKTANALLYFVRHKTLKHLHDTPVGLEYFRAQRAERGRP